MATQKKHACPDCGRMIGGSGMPKHARTHDPAYIAAREQKEAERTRALNEAIASGDPAALLEPFVAITPMQRPGWQFCGGCLRGFEAATAPGECPLCGCPKEVLV